MPSRNTLSYSSDPELDAARYAERASQEEDLERAAELSIKAQTIELAIAGKFERLLDSMEYDDNDVMVMRTLVSRAESGDAMAKAAVDKLAHTYARIHCSGAL